MTDILIRNVDSKTLKRLKERAKENRRSLQAELSSILVDAAGTEKMDMKTFVESVARIRASLAGRKQTTDSVDLIREARGR